MRDIRNSGFRIVVFVLWLLCMPCVLFAAEKVSGEKDLTAKIAALEAEHKSLQARVKNAEKTAQKGNEAHFNFQHDIVYADEKAKKLYKEMKAFEKQLNEKKQELDDWIQKLPEYRESVKKWQKAYAIVTDLRKQEILLKNEIKALKYKAGTIEE